jgi:hypothetical protein
LFCARAAQRRARTALFERQSTRQPRRGSSHPARLIGAGSDRHYGDDLLETGKVGGISRVMRQTIRSRDGGDEQVGQARRTGPSRRSGCSEYAAVGPCGFSVEGNWVPRCCSPLQPVLSARSLLFVLGGMGPCCQLSERHGSDSGLVRKQRRIDQVMIDHHGGVEQTPCWFSHRRTDLRRRPGRRATDRRPLGARGVQHPQSLRALQTCAAEAGGAPQPVRRFD